MNSEINSSNSTWVLAGEIAIDSASCHIGDPMFPRPAAFSRDPGLITNQSNIGIGVLVKTGWGDGTYPVYEYIATIVTGKPGS